MNRNSRSRNSLFNLASGIVGQFLSIVLQFVCRTIFIKFLAVEYLGVNGLFSNILSVLSLAELGMGIAIINVMYEPIAKDNKDEIIRLVNFYRKMYKMAGIIIIIVGFALIPFLDFLTNGEASKIPDIKYIYLLYLSNTSFSYFLAHKKAIIEANQKLYITTTIEKGALILQNIVQIFVLIYTKNFILYLIIQNIATIGSNIVISKVADTIYPYLNADKKKMPNTQTKKHIYKNIGAMSIHKLGAVVVYNTDNLIMSMFIGLKTVGIYSNYSLILNNLKTVFNLVFSSFTASIGNLGTEKNNEKLFEVYNMIYFFAVWIYGFITTACIVFINPLISLWVGNQYKFDFWIVILLFSCFYLDGMRKPTIVFKDALGLFWYDRYKPLAEVFINLICSVFLVMKIGFVGIFIGTALSCLLTSFWIEPWIVYKYALKKPVSDYFIKYFKWTVVIILIGFLSNISISFIQVNQVSGFLGACILYTVIYNILFFIFFGRTIEFKKIISKFKMMFF